MDDIKEVSWNINIKCYLNWKNKFQRIKCTLNTWFKKIIWSTSHVSRSNRESPSMNPKENWLELHIWIGWGKFCGMDAEVKTVQASNNLVMRILNLENKKFVNFHLGRLTNKNSLLHAHWRTLYCSINLKY